MLDLKSKSFNLPKKWALNYFKSGEWQVVEERLNDLDRNRKSGEDYAYSPCRSNLFAALHAISPGQVRVGFVGQDPYPNPRNANGLAFSVFPSVTNYPPTLENIIREYQDDLGFPEPHNGDLSPWVGQGVLLWNAYPSVQVGKPGSHHWEEWTYLTKELLDRLSSQGVILVYFGRVAQSFAIPGYERQLFTSHPSPLGAKYGFKGSRIFSRINDMVPPWVEQINWRLP